MYISGGLCFQERGLRDNTEQERVRQWGGSVCSAPKADNSKNTGNHQRQPGNTNKLTTKAGRDKTINILIAKQDASETNDGGADNQK